MSKNDENLELLDLAMGALSPEAEAEVRRRVAESPELEDELRALEEGLALAARMPTSDPPPSMDEAILAAAREQVAAKRAAEAPKRESLGARLFAFLHETIRGPQVAMATITLLVVAVGLWFIPTAERDSEESTALRISDASKTPPEEGEPALESAAEAPEPHQSATGGVIKIELEEKKIERAEPSAPERTKTRTRPKRQPATKAAPPREAEAPPDRAEANARSAAVKRSATSSGGSMGAATESASTRHAPRASAGAPAPRSEVSANEVTALSAEDAAPAPSRLPTARRHFSEGRYGEASAIARAIAASPSSSERTALAEAYDLAARSERARGRCDAAVPYYRQLLSKYPGYGRHAAASSELEDCLSRTSKAR